MSEPEAQPDPTTAASADLERSEGSPSSEGSEAKDEQKGKFSAEDWARLRRLLALVRPYRLTLGFAFLIVLGSSVLALANPVVMRFLVDAIVPGGDPADLGRAAFALLGIFAAQSLFSALSSYALGLTGERIVFDLRKALFEHLETLSLDFFNSRRTGELVSRLTQDVTTVKTLLSDDLSSSLYQVLVFIGAMIVIFTMDWRLTLTMLALIPVVTVLSLLFGRRLRKFSRGISDELAAATTVAEETISGIRVVQSFRREDYEAGRYAVAIRRALDLTTRQIRLSSAFGPILSFLFFGVTVLILWFGGRRVLEGDLTTGQLVTFIVLTMMLAGSIAQMSGIWARLQQALGATQRIFEILDLEPTISDPQAFESMQASGVLAANEEPATLSLRPDSIQGHLVFDDVSFDYAPDAKGVPALVSLDFEVRPGEILALVGPSGAGKTTLVNLIPRFFDPTGGRILLDGQDLRSLSLDSLRREVAVVPQDTHLFGGTIRDNLLYGRLEASQEELAAAARAANAEDFIEALPEGYETVVGERGIRLSGGQRQRLAIARALLKDARVLLLDEATSALDSESERQVQEALERLMEGRTSIVIAHRLSTILHADRIAVLDGGSLVEIGSHEELLDRDGLYAHLYRIQFRRELGKGKVASDPEEEAGGESGLD